MRDKDVVHGAQMRARHRHRGITLLELLVTLAVASILLTVAVPNMQVLVQNNRTVSSTNELVSALNVARAEAIKRGESVSLSALVPSQRLGGGACIHTGNSCDDDTRIREYGVMSRMEVSAIAGNDQRIIFDARGLKTSPAGAVVIQLSPESCTPGASGRARTVTVHAMGRITTRPADC